MENIIHVQRTHIQHFESKIIPYFGNALIKHISAIQLMDWQNELLETFKASSVKKYRTVFNGILEDAGKEFLNGKKIITENSRTGMKPGEIVGLRWSDIDFDNEMIRVRRTRIQDKNGPPKKKESVRDIEMLPGVKEFFLAQYRLTGGNSKGDIFLNSSKKPFYSHDIIAKKFKDLLEDGDKHYLYQLRHSFATLMVSEGEDILWVSRMLGHKSSDITLKIYARAYKLSDDKEKHKKRALFLEKGHSMGTVNNVHYLKARNIGENR